LIATAKLLLPLLKTQDMQEGTKAFMEKREPKFEGC
jgi:1,4-dihydroxy-2-naphthoyl-CoA synthase